MDLSLYNSRSRSLELFKSLKPGEVGLYSCGPTVYQYAHIGNLRAYVMADVLRRTLEYAGYATKHVMNITDVGHLVGDGDTGEDKLEKAAHKEGKTAWEIASFYTDAILHDIAALNIQKPHIIARATAHIPEQIALIKQLEGKGFTYVTADGVYFDTSKFEAYGPMSGQPLADLLAGARVEANPDKHNPADFALWKFSSDSSGSRRQMEWESPWGVGFPGWHIECSAMSTKYLGQPFDIHTGGIDLLFPHHTDEIAQSEAANDGTPLANYWLHNEFVMVDGGKMSKSLGNTYTLQDAVDRGHEPLAFRYLLLGTHYRKPVNFTWESLAGAQQGLAKLCTAVRALPVTDETLDATLEEDFRTRIKDDLGLPQALALLWEVLKSDRSDAQKSAAVAQWDQVLGLGLAELLGATADIPADVEALVAAREQARGERDFARADELRGQIEAAGYEIDDTPAGPTLHATSHPTEL